jgi:hypothetical protein
VLLERHPDHPGRCVSGASDDVRPEPSNRPYLDANPVLPVRPDVAARRSDGCVRAFPVLPEEPYKLVEDRSAA